MFSITLDSDGLCMVEGSAKGNKVIQEKVKEIKKSFKETKTLAISRLTYSLFLESADFDHYVCIYTMNNRGLSGVEMTLTFDKVSKLKDLLSDLLN